MANHKLLIWMILILALPVALALNQNQFSNGLNRENISFTNDTVERFIQLPIYINVSNASLTLNYKADTHNASSTLCTSAGCTYSYRMSDNNIDSYGNLYGGGFMSSVNLTFNINNKYSKKNIKINGSEDLGLNYFGLYTEVIDNCTNNDKNISISLEYYNSIDNHLNIYCYNTSNYNQRFKFLVYTPGSAIPDYYIYEISLIESNDYTNISLDAGENDKVYEANYLGLSNTSNINLEFTTKLNTLGGCTCTNCSISGAYCNYPIYLYYNNTGILEVSPNVTYTYQFELNNCSRGVPALNISFKKVDETAASVNYSITSTYSFNGVSQSYNQTSKEKNNFSICIYPNYINITGDINTYYTVGTAVYSYSAAAFQFDNITNYLSLYVAEGTSLVLLNVKDNLNTNLQNVYISVMQYDSSTATYKLTSVLQTDSSGNAVASLILNTQWYKFILSYNGATMTDGPSLIISNSKSFTMVSGSGSTVPDTNTEFSMGQSLIYDNVTNRFVYTFSDPSLSVTSGCLEVTKSNSTIKDSVVYSSCIASSSNTLQYDVADRGNASYVGKGWLYVGTATYFPLFEYKTFGGATGGLSTSKKADLLFFSVMLVLAVVFGLITGSPVVVIVAMIGMIDLLKMAQFISINTGALVGLNILTAIVVWRLAKSQ